MVFVFSIFKAVVIMIMMIIILVTTTTLIVIIIKGCSSIGQAMSLFSRNHQFECHKPQGCWRLTWLLTFRALRV
jgi:hypothetical protein